MGGIHISGVVPKGPFKEDLYVEIFDHEGNQIDELVLQDIVSSNFEEVISKSYPPGMYVAQIEHYDFLVNDFFRIR